MTRTGRLGPALVGLCSILVAAMCAPPPPPISLPALPLRDVPVSYARDVEPVLENRCVVCHGCYDAPCQLKLSSFEGVERGGTQAPIYDSSRLREAEPSRLFIDAKTTAAWRTRGFHSVTTGDAAGQALLQDMLALGLANPLPADEKIPETVPISVTRELTCASDAGFDAYANGNPHGGMPYAMAPLSEVELAVLNSWVEQGAPPPPPPPPLPAATQAQIDAWETLLNGGSLRERITARYLYEHWLFAHLQLDGLPTGPFFEIIRSTTPPGSPPDAIASRRPFDDPGTDAFWYRIVPIRETIVHKTHIVYPFGAEKRRRIRALFLESALPDTDWSPTRFPDWGLAVGANPFVSFDQIPPRVRYQFLLDDAQYFVMTFIRGPVCRGQVAVDVIQDHFFVAFVEPEHDLTIIDPGFLEANKDLLWLPGEMGSKVRLGGLWAKYDVKQRRYLDARAKAYAALDPGGKGPTLDWIWDGGPSGNPNAQLTILRHFDNANVIRGWVGGTPKTAWVMDYPIFERIYYDLVANFDVFGNVTHQVSTRLYMDQLRMQAEDDFLAFLPADRREEIRASWYVGATDQLSYRTDSTRWTGPTAIEYATDDPKAELIEMLIARTPRIARAPDRLNRCAEPPCNGPGASAVERLAEARLQRMTSVRGPWVRELPEVTLLRVRAETAGERDAVYTLVHNRAHTNVASMFDEAERLEPEDDTMLAMSGYIASYPNFLFDVRASQLDAFASQLEAVKSPADFESLAARYGVRRTSPRFWETFDWIHDDFRRREPTRFGLFDLDRYANH